MLTIPHLHRRTVLGLLAGLLVGAILATLLLRPTTRSAPVVSHAAATGSGTACTEAAPCTIATWVSSDFVVPGATLVLEDGEYRGSSGRVDIPDAFAGTATAPITIRARHDGAVLLNGQGARPVNLRGSYGVLEGVNITEGDNHTVRFHDTSHHWTLRRAVVWETNLGDGIVNLSGSHNLVEDVAIFGSGRKSLTAGAAGSKSDGNVIRRVWLRWETNEHPTSNPTNALEVGYGQSGVTAESVLATRDLRAGGRASDPYGAFQMFATRRSRILGSIFYATASAAFHGNAVLTAYNDGGSHAQSGDYFNTQDVLVKHIVAVIDPGNAKHASIKGCSFAEATDGAPPGARNTIDSLVCVGGLPSTFSTPTWGTPTNIAQGASIPEAIGESKSVFTDSPAAPGICYRYHNGILTNEPLWPWPMNERIKAVSGVDVTAHIEQVLGPIPAVCKTGAPPIPPEPQPGPVAMVCSGRIEAVPGDITLACVPQPQR